MEKCIAQMWDYMMDNAFCEETSLFYDYMVPGLKGQFVEYLPSPELIKLQIPNPCSWGSGMEDGVMIGSTMLDSALLSYELEKSEQMAERARKFFAGLRTCASVSESEGFLARNVSPVDGVTHYSDSSRDQYTHWIYSVSKYYESDLSTEEEKEFIRKTLCAFARRARKNVIKENNWNLLREDGGLGLVTGMWDTVDPHEMMRLPMFYLAAWKIGGDESFREDYMKFRDEALANSEKIDFGLFKRLFAVNQMMLSFRFIYDYEEDEAFKKKCLGLIRILAEHGRQCALRFAEENSTPECVALFHVQAKPWDKLTAKYDGFLSGYPYYTPMQFNSSLPEMSGAWLLRDVGDSAMIYLTSPEAEYSEELMEALKKVSLLIDFERLTSVAPTYLLNPYYMLLKLKNSGNTCKS